MERTYSPVCQSRNHRPSGLVRPSSKRHEHQTPVQSGHCMWFGPGWKVRLVNDEFNRVVCFLFWAIKDRSNLLVITMIPVSPLLALTPLFRPCRHGQGRSNRCDFTRLDTYVVVSIAMGISIDTRKALETLKVGILSYTHILQC